MSLTPNCEDPTRGLIPKEIQAEKPEERNENTLLQEQSMCYAAFMQCTSALSEREPPHRPPLYLSRLPEVDVSGHQALLWG